MLAALVIAIVPMAVTTFGGFTVQEFDWGTRLSHGKHSLVMGATFQHPPVMSPDGERLAFALTAELCYIDTACRKHTVSGEMEYASMPTALTPGDDVILFYNGAPHYLPSELESRQAFLDGSKDHVVEARSYSGELLWRKPALEVGIPVVALNDGQFLTLRESYPEVGINDTMVRVIGKDGTRLKSWRLPRLDWTGVSVEKGQLPGIIEFSKASGQASTFRIVEVEPSPSLGRGPLPNGFRATIQLIDQRLVLWIKHPRPAKYVRWSAI